MRKAITAVLAVSVLCVSRVPASAQSIPDGGLYCAMPVVYQFRVADVGEPNVWPYGPWAFLYFSWFEDAKVGNVPPRIGDFNADTDVWASNAQGPIPVADQRTQHEFPTHHTEYPDNWISPRTFPVYRDTLPFGWCAPNLDSVFWNGYLQVKEHDDHGGGDDLIGAMVIARSFCYDDVFSRGRKEGWTDNHIPWPGTFNVEETDYRLWCYSPTFFGDLELDPPSPTAGDWWFNGPCLVEVYSDGVVVAVINEWGEREQAFQDWDGRLHVLGWDITGTLSGDGQQLQWSNGTTWLRSEPGNGGGSGVLQSGEILYPEESIYSPNGVYRLRYQIDGNLVVYANEWTPLWWTGTDGTSPGYAVMQGDGNFVVYDGEGNAVFDTHTWFAPGAVIKIQDDGNLVVYDTDGNAVWARSWF